MAKTQFLDWDAVASNNTDINGIGILGVNAVSNFDDAFRTLMAQLRAGVDGEVAYAAKSGNYTAVLNDNNAWHRYTATATVSLTAAATLGANWHYYVQADGAVVTIDPNGAETINGAATLVLQSGQTASIICTGSAFIAVVEGTVITGPGQQGYLYGLTLSNNSSDSTNDIDIATGVAAADTSPYSLMQLTSGLTKRLDAAWAVGTGNGGRMSAAAIADGTYHMWLIQRSDTGVVDVGFDVSATAPTMPANYDRKRRIGSIMRVSGAIVQFTQTGDNFVRAVRVVDVSTLNPGTAAVTRTLSVPTGILVFPFGTAQIELTTASAVTVSCLLTDLARADADSDPGTVGGTVTLSTLTAGGSQRALAYYGTIRTNTSAQIRSRFNVSGPATNFILHTDGWVDTRGRI